MRLAFISIMAMLSFGFAVADDTTRTTTTGAVFSRNMAFPQLGEAWQAPSLNGAPGLIWGDMAQTDSGEAYNATISEAIQYCESINARLPTKEDFEALRQMMGAAPGTHKGYTPQVLPNLGIGLWFWAWPADSKGRVYEFISSYGDIVWNDAGDMSTYNPHDPFRCVVEPQK